MRKLEVQSGTRFSRLVVLSEAERMLTPSGEPKRAFNCICDCGKNTVAPLAGLRSGKYKSCGCLNQENKTKHGMARTRIYGIWANMVNRCECPSNNKYSYYGGRGIHVCERWKIFENFYADMGDAPEGLSLDRIDNNGNYEPGNVRWATDKQQMRNTRVTSRVTIGGETKSYSEWSELLDIPRSTLRLMAKRSNGNGAIA